MNLRFLYRAYRARLRDQRQEIAGLRSIVCSGDVAVDVGAHKGVYCYGYAGVWGIVAGSLPSNLSPVWLPNFAPSPQAWDGKT